jgi:hypothetical protein
MLTYLLEKLDKIKKERAFYCSQIEETQIKETRIEETQIKETQIKETPKGLTAYDFFCRKN